MTPEFMAALELLAENLRALSLGGLAVLARVGAMMALLPVFGEQAIPARLRLGAALALSAIVAPAVPVATPDTPGDWLWLLGTESVAGLALGAGLRMFVWTLQIAGTMAAQATSLSQAFGGAGADPQPAIAQVLMMAGLALMVLTGMPERAAEYVILSYDILPPGQWPVPETLADWGRARVVQGFALAFSLAAPFVLGAAVYNLALGAINRAMPQLMVAFVGAPALTAGGLVLLLLAAPVMLAVWFHALDQYLLDPR
jgi:flagellar biosynthetic protein FliR